MTDALPAVSSVTRTRSWWEFHAGRTAVRLRHLGRGRDDLGGLQPGGARHRLPRGRDRRPDDDDSRQRAQPDPGEQRRSTFTHALVAGARRSTPAIRQPRAAAATPASFSTSAGCAPDRCDIGAYEFGGTTRTARRRRRGTATRSTRTTRSPWLRPEACSPTTATRTTTRSPRCSWRSVARASFQLNANGSFTYTPAADYNGSDSFTYKARDTRGGGVEHGHGHDHGNAANDPPTAVRDGYSTDEDMTLVVPAPGVLGNDGDPDGDVAHGSALSLPSHYCDVLLWPDRLVQLHTGRELQRARQLHLQGG